VAFGVYSTDGRMSLCKWADQLDQRRLGITSCVSDIDNQRYPTIVEYGAADFNDFYDTFFCLF